MRRKTRGQRLIVRYMATILWATRLERLRDKSGSEVPLDTETPVDTGMSL
jgi:hypothetical protein